MGLTLFFGGSTWKAFETVVVGLRMSWKSDLHSWTSSRRSDGLMTSEIGSWRARRERWRFDVWLWRFQTTYIVIWATQQKSSHQKGQTFFPWLQEDHKFEKKKRGTLTVSASFCGFRVVGKPVDVWKPSGFCMVLHGFAIHAIAQQHSHRILFYFIFGGFSARWQPSSFEIIQHPKLLQKAFWNWFTVVFRGLVETRLLWSLPGRKKPRSMMPRRRQPENLEKMKNIETTLIQVGVKSCEWWHHVLSSQRDWNIITIAARHISTAFMLGVEGSSSHL